MFGWTTDLARRLREHNGGAGARSTRGRQWVLLYSEACEDKRSAMSREWRLARRLRKRLRESLAAPAVTIG